MFGLAGAEALVGSARLAKFRSLGFVTVGIFTLGRVVLVLPALPRPRLVAGDWIWVVGGGDLCRRNGLRAPRVHDQAHHWARRWREPEDRRILPDREESPRSFRCVVVPRFGNDVPLGDRHRSGSRVVGGSVAINDNRGRES